MSVASLVLAACLAAAPQNAYYRGTLGAPETFRANAQSRGPLGAAVATIHVVIQRYTTDDERRSIEDALANGGYAAFVTALRRSSDVGYVEHGTAKIAIRYAREVKTASGRRIDVVTDAPIYFVGGGMPDGKSRAGFDVAALRMEVDEIGYGSGEMAAAARLKSAPDGGVQIDDYGGQPIKLVTVTRKLP